MADGKISLKVSGLGDVLAPEGGAIGEGVAVAFRSLRVVLPAFGGSIAHGSGALSLVDSSGRDGIVRLSFPPMEKASCPYSTCSCLVSCARTPMRGSEKGHNDRDTHVRSYIFKVPLVQIATIWILVIVRISNGSERGKGSLCYHLKVQ